MLPVNGQGGFAIRAKSFDHRLPDISPAEQHSITGKRTGSRQATDNQL